MLGWWGHTAVMQNSPRRSVKVLMCGRGQLKSGVSQGKVSPRTGCGPQRERGADQESSSAGSNWRHQEAEGRCRSPQASQGRCRCG